MTGGASVIIIHIYTYYITPNTYPIVRWPCVCVCAVLCINIFCVHILYMYIVHPRADGWTDDNNVSTVRVVRRITLDAVAGYAPGAAA